MRYEWLIGFCEVAGERTQGWKRDPTRRTRQKVIEDIDFHPTVVTFFKEQPTHPGRISAEPVPCISRAVAFHFLKAA